jgi:hypothetical protein
MLYQNCLRNTQLAFSIAINRIIYLMTSQPHEIVREIKRNYKPLKMWELFHSKCSLMCSNCQSKVAAFVNFYQAL